MKSYITCFSFLACLGVLSSLSGQSMTFENKPFSDGEQIVYRVYYNLGMLWIAAGDVTFDVTEMEDHVEFRVTGKSLRTYDGIFKVRDYYVSKVKKETMLPYDFKRDVHEGKYIRFDSIAFDQENRNLIEYFGHTRDKAERFEFKVDDYVHDMVSVIYQLRDRDISLLQEKDKIPVNIFFDKENFKLDVNYLGIERERIRGQGKQWVHRFQPELISGYVFEEGDLMDIWVSDDGCNVPMMIESPITIGSVKAVLTHYKKDSGSQLMEVKDYMQCQSNK